MTDLFLYWHDNFNSILLKKVLFYAHPGQAHANAMHAYSVHGHAVLDLLRLPMSDMAMTCLLLLLIPTPCTVCFMCKFITTCQLYSNYSTHTSFLFKLKTDLPIQFLELTFQ